MHRCVVWGLSSLLWSCNRVIIAISSHLNAVLLIFSIFRPVAIILHIALGPFVENFVENFVAFLGMKES